MQTSEWICNKLGVEVATNFEWKLQQSTKCDWKLLRKPAVGGCNKLRSEMEVGRNCGWKMKMQETPVGSCKKLRWAIPTNCKWWKLQQTTKREAVTNFFENVSFENVVFQKLFFQNVFVQLQLEVATNCGWSYNTLQLQSTSEWIYNKLGVGVKTNFEWKLQQYVPEHIDFRHILRHLLPERLPRSNGCYTLT